LGKYLLREISRLVNCVQVMRETVAGLGVTR
jgi:hypothetical protein